MARMGDIEREAAEAVAHWFRHPNDHHDQETTVTMPAAPRNALADIANGVNELAANPLIERLAREGLGRLLVPGDAEHVVAIVRALEAPHQQAAANVPPQPPA